MSNNDSVLDYSTMNMVLHTYDFYKGVPSFSKRMDAVCNYLVGNSPPHYPVPCVLGNVDIHPDCVMIWSVDETHAITWWNEAYDLPMPDDHGVWVPM